MIPSGPPIKKYVPGAVAQRRGSDLDDGLRVYHLGFEQRDTSGHALAVGQRSGLPSDGKYGVRRIQGDLQHGRQFVECSDRIEKYTAKFTGQLKELFKALLTGKVQLLHAAGQLLYARQVVFDLVGLILGRRAGSAHPHQDQAVRP